ncbi:MAG: hypothetical protein WC045_03200 [Patescibacteria group bacterium]
MAIIISKNGKDAKKVDKSTFDREDYLQQYIYDNPESIPLYEIREDIRMVILAREFNTNSGPIDAIGFDKDGEIYIVETKLYKNPDKRTVVAQALDYGAALWRHANDFNVFIDTLNAYTSKHFQQSVQEKLQNFYEISEDESLKIVEKVRTNLNDGIFHFVVLMDQLSDRLKDLVVYVNQNSQFDIYAVELEYYRHEEHEIIIPKIFGAEVKKDIKVSTSNSARKRWSEDELLNAAKSTLSSEGYAAFEKLYVFSKEHADNVSFGTGTSSGSFSPIFSSVCPRSLFTLRTNGTLSLNFQWINGYDGAEEFRSLYFDKMRQIGLDLLPADIEKYPNFSLDQWLQYSDNILAVLSDITRLK